MYSVVFLLLGVGETRGKEVDIYWKENIIKQPCIEEHCSQALC